MHLRLFLSPLLLKVVVRLSEPQEDIGAPLFHLLSSMKDISPNIQCIKIPMNSSLNLLGPFPETTFALQYLREFSCPKLSLKGPFLAELALLPFLTTLDIRIDSITELSSLSGQAFPLLSSLQIWSSSIEHCTSLLPLISSNVLRFVDMLVYITPSSAQVCKLLEAIAEHPSQKHISSLYLNTSFNLHSFPMTTRHTITPSVLRPLLSLSNLDEISISLECEFSLDDVLLRDMAVAWPKLKTFQLGSRTKQFMNHYLKTTLNGLVPFAFHCPLLESLSVAVDARKSSPIDLTPQQHLLRHLDVGFSPIHIPATVAAFLSGIFPSIVELKASGPDVHFWYQVTSLLKEFRTVRQQERMLALKAIQGETVSSSQYVKCESCSYSCTCPYLESSRGWKNHTRIPTFFPGWLANLGVGPIHRWMYAIYSTFLNDGRR